MPDEINKFVADDEQYVESASKPEAEEATPVEDHPEEEAEETTEQATAEEETPVETTPPPDPYSQRFTELGLNSQFRDVDDLLNRVPYMNKWQTQLSQENADLKRRIQEEEARAKQQAQQQQQPQYDPERFLENPYQALDGRYLTKEEAQQIQQQFSQMQNALVEQRVGQFKTAHPDYDQMEPVMMQILSEEPGAAYLKDPLGYLYKEAKSRVAPIQQKAVEETKNKVNQSIEANSKRAETAGSGRKAPPAPKKPLTREDLYKMPLEDLKKALGGYGPDDE